jgi:hypothetical protein
VQLLFRGLDNGSSIVIVILFRDRFPDYGGQIIDLELVIFWLNHKLTD